MVYVFGHPITDETLKGMAEYKGRKTTLKDRAHVAPMMKNADDKDVKVRQQVEILRQKAEHGDRVGATVCLLYNATGDTLTLVTHCDWNGQAGFTPYPPKIENGQWGVLPRVVDANMDDGSVGAVVYRSKNANGDDGSDWMHAWTNTTSSKRAYSEIRELKHWDDGGLWGVVRDIWAALASCTGNHEKNDPQLLLLATTVSQYLRQSSRYRASNYSMHLQNQHRLQGPQSLSYIMCAYILCKFYHALLVHSSNKQIVI